MTMTEPLCRGRRCIVFGSAPGLRVPDVRPEDVILGGNGGSGLAAKRTGRVDVAVMTSRLFRGPVVADIEEATKDLLRGITPQSLWADEKCNPLMDEHLAGLGIVPGRVHRLNDAAREAVVVAAIGRPEWVSTGVWAICLAVASGASEVLYTGISPDAKGHEEMPWEPPDKYPRGHVAEDRRCLVTLLEMGAIREVPA